MSASADTLRRLLEAINAKEHASRFVRAFARRLEPVIATIEKGVYPLVPASSLDADTVADVIAGAIAMPVSVIVFVSESRPLPKPAWMTEEAFRAMTAAVDLRRNIGETMASALRAAFVPGGEGLPFDDLGAGVVADVHESLSRSRLASIAACAYFFGRASIAADRSGMERLVRLMELLPKAVPLGEKKDAPGTWLVLCA